MARICLDFAWLFSQTLITDSAGSRHRPGNLVDVSLIPVKKLGVYTGIAGMITSFAPALSPTYGGLLNHYLSWRMIFWCFTRHF